MKKSLVTHPARSFASSRREPPQENDEDLPPPPVLRRSNAISYAAASAEEVPAFIPDIPIKGVTDIPKFDEGDGMVVSLEGETETFWGIGQFEPTRDYEMLEVVDTSVTKGPKSSYQSCFLIVPREKKAVYFFKKEDLGYINDDETTKKDKIKSILEKIARFDILPGEGAKLVFLDAPNQKVTSNVGPTYHRDNGTDYFLKENVKNSLRVVKMGLINGHLDSFPSKYTCIEYRTTCASTTVKNPLNEGDILRFLACPGTVFCIENVRQQHSSPYIQRYSIGVDRTVGDQMVRDSIVSREANGTYRYLYRTQFYDVSDEQHDLIFGQLVEGRDYIEIHFDDAEWERMTGMESFPKSNATEYLSGERSHELGGMKINRKRRTKRRSKRKFVKSKKSRRIRRIRVNPHY
jgi:hypothetical protein